MIQQGFSWQDEGKIKKLVHTKCESVEEGSMLLFSMTEKSHTITPVTLKSVSEAELRAQSQPNACKCKTEGFSLCSKNIQLLLLSQKINRKYVTISLTFCRKSWQIDQDAAT